jgi:two-component system NtrC family sensor kinase
LAVLGEVAAVMAHELNNPLAAISLYNQMLATELAENESVQENVEVIQRNVESCKRTIRDLLDYSNNQTPAIGAVDVNATLEDVSSFLRLLRERSNVRITLDLAPLPLEVKMDEIQLRQIFVNLLVNAIQAIGPGGGEVSVKSSREDGYAAVDVVDSGCGIPAEMRQRIFRPFFSTKERGEGTGLGLPTARRITEMHGGTLQLLESSPAGSRFRVRLLLDTALVRRP